jgi:hypothetical protein
VKAKHSAFVIFCVSCFLYICLAGLVFASLLSSRTFARSNYTPPVPPKVVVARFFDTPFEKMSKIDNNVFPVTPKESNQWTGCIVFDCETVPVLKEQGSYKPAGDVISQIDSNLAKFGSRAWPLLRSKEVGCISKMFDPNGDPPTYNTLIYNRNSKTYFFHHNDRPTLFN